MRLTACLVAALVLGLPSAAGASATQESTFQDDHLLVEGTARQQRAALDAMKALGADIVRVTMRWRLVAPDPEAAQKPAGFDGANPAAYPAHAWDRYDRLVRAAGRRGMQVAFVLGPPAPNWATGTPPDQPELDPTFDPLAPEYGAFVHAAAARYPTVGTWSIWDEPNQPGDLTPQWLRDPRDPRAWVETSPRIYRSLVDAAWTALQETGHGGDTILIGETAPKGLVDQPGVAGAMDPHRFIRLLYCLDDNLQFLQGSDAQARGCPEADQALVFVRDHPALFLATGWAHHPYELILAPNREPSHSDAWITLGNLNSLSGLLRRIRARYGVPAVRVPLYLTQYGYRTDDLGVSPRRQAEYLNHAEYLAWRNPAVRTLGQRPLRDGDPPLRSGLRTRSGARKPSWDAYALPLWLPDARVRPGARLRVWGLVRAAPNGQRVRVRIQVRDRGAAAWRTVARGRTMGTRGYLTASVRVARSGFLRLVWGRRHSSAAAFVVR
jgi:hypothetical protein